MIKNHMDKNKASILFPGHENESFIVHYETIGGRFKFTPLPAEQASRLAGFIGKVYLETTFGYTPESIFHSHKESQKLGKYREIEVTPDLWKLVDLHESGRWSEVMRSGKMPPDIQLAELDPALREIVAYSRMIHNSRSAEKPVTQEPEPKQKGFFDRLKGKKKQR